MTHHVHPSHKGAFGRLVLFAALLAAFLSACTPERGRVYYPSPEPSPGAINAPATEPAALPISLPTEIITPTATQSVLDAPPSLTPTPAVSRTTTSTLSPTYTPYPTSALPSLSIWGLMPTREGLWAMKPDGTLLLKLTNDPIYHLSVSPSGRMAAYVTHPDPYNQAFVNPFGYMLRIITLPEGKVYDIASLDMWGIGPGATAEELEFAYQAVSVYDYGGMDWSPNGYYLAYSSANEGPAADVFIYTPSAGRIMRISNDSLPNGPANAYALEWSPDNTRVFYNRAYSFGTGAGHWMAGSWVGSSNGTSVQVADDRYAGERLIDWPRNETLLMSSWMSDCGNQNLRLVDTRTGEAQVLWSHCYDIYQYDPQRGEILISVPEDMAALQEGSQPGLFRYWTWQSTSDRISEKSFERLYRGDDTVSWYAYNAYEGLFAVQANGTVEPLFTGPPYDNSTNLRLRPYMRVSGDTAWFWSGDGFYVAKPGEQPQMILPYAPDSFFQPPDQVGLYYFTTTEAEGPKIYAIRVGEWIPMEVTDQVQMDGIYWLRP